MATIEMTENYQIINGVYYKKEALGEVIKALEFARQNNIRVSIIYGDPKTGRFWNKGAPVCGYVSKRNAKEPVPILLHGKNSSGGVCVMDGSILEIKELKTNKILYKWSEESLLLIEETYSESTLNKVVGE